MSIKSVQKEKVKKPKKPKTYEPSFKSHIRGLSSKEEKPPGLKKPKGPPRLFGRSYA